MIDLKKISNRYKTDPSFRQKLLKGSVGLVFVIGFIVFMNYKDNKKSNDETGQTTKSKGTIDDYILADTTQIIDDKNIIYNNVNNEQIKDGSEVVVNTNSVATVKDDKINDYLEHRKKSMENLNNNSSSSYEASTHRRSYNPNPSVPINYSRTTNYQEESAVAGVPITPLKKETEDLPKERTLEDIIRQKNKKNNSSASNSNGIKVAIHQDQTISYGNSTVRLRLVDPVVIDGVEISTNQFIYAKATFSNDVINLRVENINYNGTIIPVNLVAYDYRTGNKGLSISQDNVMSTVEKVGERQVENEISKAGSIGSIVKDIFNGRNKKNKINLINETYLFLKKEK